MHLRVGIVHEFKHISDRLQSHFPGVDAPQAEDLVANAQYSHGALEGLVNLRDHFKSRFEEEFYEDQHVAWLSLREYARDILKGRLPLRGGELHVDEGEELCVLRPFVVGAKGLAVSVLRKQYLKEALTECLLLRFFQCGGELQVDNAW